MASLAFNVVAGIRLVQGSKKDAANPDHASADAANQDAASIGQNNLPNITGNMAATEAPAGTIGDYMDENGELLPSNPPVAPDQIAPLPTPRRDVDAPGLHSFSGLVTQSLSATFVGVEQTSPAAMTAIFSRLFAWDVDMRRAIHRGDEVKVIYEQANRNEPKILAAQLVLKRGTGKSPGEGSGVQVLTAYRFHAPGDTYPSYWTKDGQEVPRRLIMGPLASYEQIATLFSDRPSHMGMDFKVNIGTLVVSPRAGVVTRVDFDKVTNGNCVEIRYSDGVLASFLHLNETLVHPGERITGGTVIGKSGNTGRSPGAHLHYQLMQGGKALDPMLYHGSLRRSLQPEAMAEFTRLVSSFEATFANTTPVIPGASAPEAAAAP